MPGVALDGTGRVVYPGVDQTASYTRLWILEMLAADATWCALLSGETAANVGNWTSERAAGGIAPVNSLTNSRVLTGVFDMVWTDPMTLTQADGPTLLVEGKLGGGGNAVQVRKFRLDLETLTWVEAPDSPDTMDPQLANGDPLGPGGIMALGAYQGGDNLAANVWGLAIWDGVLLSPAEITSIAAAQATAAILDLAPTRCYDASDGLIGDLTGSGNDRISALGAGAAPNLPPGAWAFAGGTSFRRSGGLWVPDDIKERAAGAWIPAVRSAA